MLNKVLLIGRLGKDPELNHTYSGAPVTTLILATDSSYTDAEGERIERTEWHRVVVFGHQAETCTAHLRKSSLVFVEGSLQTRKWQDKAGEEHTEVEVKAQKVLFLERSKLRDQDNDDDLERQ